MIYKGQTKSGFNYEIDTDAMNDMEVVDLMVDMMNEDGKLDELHAMVAVKTLLDKILGKDQKKALYKHLADENGRVPIDKVNTEFVEIMASTKTGKN